MHGTLNLQGYIIGGSNNVHIDGLTFEDSPQMHIAFESSEWVKATSLTIQAPKHSPNTDGIHIQHSKNIIIYNTSIGTGRKLHGIFLFHMYHHCPFLI